MSRLRRAAPWAADAFEDYLNRYCHRTVTYDPGDTTLFERSDIVAGLLAKQTLAQTGTTAEASTDPDPLVQARRALATRSEEERARFENALRFAQRAYAQREDNIFWLDNQPCALLRYCALEFGRRLTQRGALAHANDAVFLEAPELHRALADSEDQDLRALVAQRRAERAWVIAHPGPASYGKDPGDPPDLAALQPSLRLVNTAFASIMQLMVAPSAPQEAADQLRGVPGSPGHYTGTVRVVRDQTEFTKLRPGDVLVSPTTSPPWSVLFLQAGAVITDGGGVLSHTAIIAREYAIPAVLATGEATRRLHDGDTVSVDGHNGTVSIITAAPALTARSSTI